jgi:hypothetical protein
MAQSFINRVMSAASAIGSPIQCPRDTTGGEVFDFGGTTAAMNNGFSRSHS